MRRTRLRSLNSRNRLISSGARQAWPSVSRVKRPGTSLKNRSCKLINVTKITLRAPKRKRFVPSRSARTLALLLS